MTAGSVFSVIDHLDIVDRVGNQITQCLVVGFCRETIALVVDAETVVIACYEMDASRTLDLFIECGISDAVNSRCIAQFLEEWRLIVESGCKSQCGVLAVGWDNTERNTWTEEGLLVEAPMAHAHTIVQREMGMSSRTRETIGILQIGFRAVGIEGVSCLHRVYHVEVFSIVRNTIASAVSHLVFYRIFRDMFLLIGICHFDVMFFCLVFQDGLGTQDAGGEIVACMFEIGSNAQIFRGFCLVKPVLSLNVVFLLFLTIEGTSQNRKTGLVGNVAGDAERTEVGEETVFLLSVKIDSETLYVLLGSECCLSVVRKKVVMVVGDISDEIYLPSLVGTIAQVCLVVEEIRLVLGLCVGGSQQVTVGLIAYAVEP